MNIFPWQEDLWRKLVAMQDRLPHALLMRGQEGIGKLDFATHLAKSLLCSSPDKSAQACGSCPSCGWFDQSSHPDYKVLSPESEAGDDDEQPTSTTSKKSQISVAQVRQLSGFFELTSHQSGRRVVLVHPAETLNAASANALLKILEEPPAGVIFILISHRPQRLLPTITSRCQKLDMPVPLFDTAVQWLGSQGIKGAAVQLAYAGGSPLMVLRMGPEQGKQLGDFCQALTQGPRLDPFTLAPLWIKQGMGNVIQALQKWIYDLLSCRITGEVRYHSQYLPALQALTKSVDLSLLLDFQRKLDQAKKSSTHPLNNELQLENILLQYTQIFPTPNRLR